MRESLARLKVAAQHPKTLWLGLFLVLAIIFTRFYNLDRTARFTLDESSDLVRMQELWDAKKITLVGPISNDNSKVFGSLTYYMLMPFTVAGDFHPISPVWGAAFWGVVTALTLLIITWFVNRSWLPWVALLVVIWNPLLVISRWAWNPHLVVVWISLGLLTWQIKKPWAMGLTGFLMGLAFHNHYLTIFATGIWIGLMGLDLLRQKKWLMAVALGAGFVAAFVPFVLFDLRHPPGLFFAKYILGGTPDVAQQTASAFLSRVWSNYLIVTEYLSAGALKWLVAFLIPLLAFTDRKKLSHLIWFVPILVQMLGSSVLVTFVTRYFLPALPFFVVWLVLPREGMGKWVAKALMAVCLLGAVLMLRTNLTVALSPPDIYSQNAAAEIIKEKVTTLNLKSPNIAALASPDSEPLSEKYRFLLQTKDVKMKAPSEYDTSENLFVVSTSSLEVLREDKAAPMNYFRHTEKVEKIAIPDSEWAVYWFRF